MSFIISDEESFLNLSILWLFHLKQDSTFHPKEQLKFLAAKDYIAIDLSDLHTVLIFQYRVQFLIKYLEQHFTMPLKMH